MYVGISIYFPGQINSTKCFKIHRKTNFYGISSLYDNSLKQLYCSSTFSHSGFQLSTYRRRFRAHSPETDSFRAFDWNRKFDENHPFKHILYKFFCSRVLPPTVKTYSLAHRYIPKYFVKYLSSDGLISFWRFRIFMLNIFILKLRMIMYASKKVHGYLTY